MHRAEFPDELSVSDANYERVIEELVQALVMERGYESIIYRLLSAVYQLSQTSTADPKNCIKHREFVAWAKAVRSVILRHDGHCLFDESMSDSDRAFAQQIGIRVD